MEYCAYSHQNSNNDVIVHHHVHPKSVSISSSAQPKINPKRPGYLGFITVDSWPASGMLHLRQILSGHPNDLPSFNTANWKIIIFNAKKHDKMVIFSSYFDITRGLNPIKSHETTIIPWFSFGFPMSRCGKIPCQMAPVGSQCHVSESIPLRPGCKKRHSDTERLDSSKHWE